MLVAHALATTRAAKHSRTWRHRHALTHHTRRSRRHLPTLPRSKLGLCAGQSASAAARQPPPSEPRVQGLMLTGVRASLGAQERCRHAERELHSHTCALQADTHTFCWCACVGRGVGMVLVTAARDLPLATVHMMPSVMPNSRWVPLFRGSVALQAHHNHAGKEEANRDFFASPRGLSLHRKRIFAARIWSSLPLSILNFNLCHDLFLFERGVHHGIEQIQNQGIAFWKTHVHLTPVPMRRNEKQVLLFFSSKFCLNAHTRSINHQGFIL